jgi:hypothetical protein
LGRISKIVCLPLGSFSVTRHPLGLWNLQIFVIDGLGIGILSTKISSVSDTFIAGVSIVILLI